MASGTLYANRGDYRACNILIAANYSGAKVTIDPSYKHGETNTSPAFLKKFPLGKVPALEASNGTLLFESNAIAYYVASDELRGSSPESRAEILQWTSLAESEILPASCTWVYPVKGIMQYNKQATERAQNEVKSILSTLNSQLSSRTFLVGERVSLADTTVCCHLLELYQYVLDPAARQAFPNTNRWFNTVINQPNVKAVLGEFKLCDKMGVFDSKKFQELMGQKGGKKDKPAAKKEPAKKAPKPKEDEEEEEDDMPAEKPSKDPFAALPKGSLNLDEWKKTYSNNDTLSVAMPWFWEHFDKENFSVWFCEYKYPEELGQVFMSCNLVSGMFQRLDRLRKHGFGSMLVFGEDNKNTISGVWFWRGQDLAFELSPDLQVDYESYEWKKLDFDSAETRKLITSYFAWEGDFGDKKFNQGKVFK